MENCLVYKTTNKINGRSYIGMTNGNNPDYLGSGKLIKQAIEKYGRENFQRETLEICDTEQGLREAEARWIEHFDAVSSDDFYNLMEGGRGGDTGFTKSMSVVTKAVWDSYTPEQKKNRLEKNRLRDFGKQDKTGKNNPMYGRSAVTEKNLRWFTNGVDVIYVTDGTQPEGYVRGRKIRNEDV
jgi:group I intron endonuclease